MTRILLLAATLAACVDNPESENQAATVSCYCPAGYTCDATGACIPPTNPCAAEANATPYATCQLTCTAGWGDCDHVYTNGCETNLHTSNTNCGACGRDCTPWVCNSGRCVAVNHCSSGLMDCNGDGLLCAKICP